jgi:PTH1 family peptidyl-tRNA hydrolase
VLVHDDLDLPLGVVRSRLRGSDGGHRGVRSILETFQSDQFPRVKVGVKRPATSQTAREAVLDPFTAEEQPIMNAAFAAAERRLAELAKQLIRERPSAVPAETP